jgi:molybdopterin/thiamine biosynthesis adenylyltransferase/DNA-directed RNA polymerase subunit RPC12/RpoP
MTNSVHDNILFDAGPDNDRYARHRLISWWDQEKLLSSKILVIGAGALGNEVLKNLALLGVGHVLIVDFDLIEVSNLSRTVLFTQSDIGKPKAQVAAEAIQRINPQVRTEWIHGDLEMDLGLNRIRQFDLALGCVDSVNARWALNRSCARVGVPWINAGINATAGEVALFDAHDGGCYECGMTEGMWKRFNERYSCLLLLKSLPANKVPTTTVISSMTAALQVNEAVALLHNSSEHLRPGQKLFFSLKPYKFFVVDIPRDANCMAHEAVVPSMKIEHSSENLTVSGLLDLVPDSLSLELDYDIVTSLSCSQCGPEPYCLPVKKFRTENVDCPKCGRKRLPNTVHQVLKTDALATKRLSDIGIPTNTILRVNTGGDVVYVAIR